MVAMPYADEFPLEDGIGFVRHVATLGNDLTVVNAARVSYGKRSVEMTDKDARLIRYMMKNRHGTPFEHIVFQFTIRAPLFVVHQWQRHRIGSYNEESGRYIELRPDFYIKADEFASRRREAADRAFREYKEMIEADVAKEDARTVLPSSLYKEFWWTVNARSLMNFISLRNDSHAQWEIRQYAIALEEFFALECYETYLAFLENGRVAP